MILRNIVIELERKHINSLETKKIFEVEGKSII